MRNLPQEHGPWLGCTASESDLSAVCGDAGVAYQCTAAVRAHWGVALMCWHLRSCLAPQGRWGYRPIGLLPWVVRTWMRARRSAASKWEAAVHRPYLCAGEGMGADVAAWKQAARAELAATMKSSVGYAVALLDLVKAFERVPHHILVREAKKLGYPLWLLRLSLAAYRLPCTLPPAPPSPPPRAQSQDRPPHPRPTRPGSTQ